MSRHNGYWETNPSKAEHARLMWEQGLSASTIGRALGVSKNAVIGIKNRRGWAPRKSPITPGITRPSVAIAVAKKKPDSPKPAEAPRVILRPWR